MAEWTIGGAIEHGSFLMALAAVALTGIAILLALGGVIAYIRIRYSAGKIAAQEARDTAGALAEKAANDYLQAEIPAIIAAYGELSQAVPDETADDVARQQAEEG